MNSHTVATWVGRVIHEIDHYTVEETSSGELRRYAYVTFHGDPEPQRVNVGSCDVRKDNT